VQVESKEDRFLRDDNQTRRNKDGESENENSVGLASS